MEGVEDSHGDRQVNSKSLLDNNTHAQHSPGNEDQDMMDGFATPHDDETLMDPEVSLTTMELYSLDHARFPHTPEQHRSVYFSHSSPSTSNTLRPTFLTPQPRSKFLNSSSVMVDPVPRSIFGPPLVDADDEDTQDIGDLFMPVTPCREPMQTQTTPSQHDPQDLQTPCTPNNGTTQHIPQVRQTHSTPNNETAFNFHRTAADDTHNAQQSSMIVDRDSDSDDDLMIVDEQEGSEEARRKWQEQRQAVIIEDDEQLIKTEPVTDVGSPARPPTPLRRPQVPAHRQLTLPKVPEMPSIQEVLAAQCALLNRNKGPKHSADSSGTRTTEEASSHSNNKRHYALGQIVEDDPEQVDAAMGVRSHEDDSWMSEYPDEDTERELHELKEKISVLCCKEANGKINQYEIYELGWLRKQLKLKERLLRCAKGDPTRQPQEESLFIREGDDTSHQGSGEASDEALSRMLADELEGDGVEGVPKGKEAKKAKRPHKKPAKNAREFYHRQEEERREKDRKKAQKKAKGGLGRKPAAKGKAAGKKGNTSAKGKSGRVPQATPRINQRNGIDEIGQMILDDLMNNDPITERLQNPIFDVGPEPEMHGGNVSTQLQRLLANIPDGSNAKDAKDDKAKLKQASCFFGAAKVKAKDGKWLIKGMKSTLYHHQLLGAQWMIQRELSDEVPYGGLLADSMGLGKTVQTLACMVGNPPDEDHLSRCVKATLIVVPSSVIDQWLDEIKYHTEVSAFPKVMRYKLSSNIPLAVLRDLDIAVTSYQEVMRQFPFPDQKGREEAAKTGYKKWWKKASKDMGDLFGVHWYRVVLDEAHAIKNNSARTSLACQNLKSNYRWCLTGTPLLNRLEELFPYLRFLKANYSLDWKTFRRYFCDPNANDCYDRITTVLSYTMMRRTMKTTILNRPIINLPPPHPEIRYIQFSAEELVIYRITENRFRANLNKYFASKTAKNNYGVFLVQLLRLRQCTSHPFMLEQTIRESWTSADLDELRKRLSSLEKMSKPFYEQCQVWVHQREEAEERNERASNGADGCHPIEVAGNKSGEAMPFGAGDFGRSFQFGKVLKKLSKEDMYSRNTCSLCLDLPREAVSTECNHIFCKSCLMNYMHTRSALDTDDYLACPACERLFTSFKPYRGFQDNDEDSIDSDIDEVGGSGSSSGKGKKRKDRSGDKCTDACGFEPKVVGSTWVDRSDEKDFPLVPSAKTAALKAILLKGFQEAPLDKVVIYVQFRLLAKIVGRICKSEKWGFLYLLGDCSLEHRSKVVKAFRDDPDVKILVAGLKCGGLGLNFPWANRCISLDLWWNHAVEQQAFGRIFRIGQKKETYMTRIIVKNSVDMRLLTMQLHKLKACENAIGSGEEKQKPLLSLRELAQLFGFLRTDADGEILSIEPDYQDDEQGAEGAGV